MEYLIIALLTLIIGVVIGSILGANRYAKDTAEMAEWHKVALAQQDQENAEDVRRLKDECEAEVLALKARHAKDVIRKANELHKRECSRIRKQSKERGATLGANA